jgi:aminopeptidase-like protein
LPSAPQLIPYRTSYYRETWGFCLPHERLEQLPAGEYEVFIDAELTEGSLTYGELLLPGEVPNEVLFSCHVCHPALANDNLSGIAVVATLAELLSRVTRRWSYRFLFIPGTIGSITWLARNAATWNRIHSGLVLACVGDPGHSTYKKSRHGDALIDRAVEHVLKHHGSPYDVRDFSPYGYDERQFGSPGINLAVGCLMRSPFGEYPEYHTSADNLSFIRPECLADTLAKCLAVVGILENNGTYLNLAPHGEPQLGKRGLYDTVGGKQSVEQMRMAILWSLNLSDGQHSAFDIAERAGYPFEVIQEAVGRLVKAGLLEEIRSSVAAVASAEKP